MRPWVIFCLCAHAIKGLTKGHSQETRPHARGTSARYGGLFRCRSGWLVSLEISFGNVFSLQHRLISKSVKMFPLPPRPRQQSQKRDKIFFQFFYFSILNLILFYLTLKVDSILRVYQRTFRWIYFAGTEQILISITLISWSSPFKIIQLEKNYFGTMKCIFTVCQRLPSFCFTFFDAHHADLSLKILQRLNGVQTAIWLLNVSSLN